MEILRSFSKKILTFDGDRLGQRVIGHSFIRIGNIVCIFTRMLVEKSFLNGFAVSIKLLQADSIVELQFFFQNTDAHSEHFLLSSICAI